MPRRRVGWPLAGALLLACTSGQTTQPAARVDGELALQKFGGPLTIGPTPAGLRGTAPEDCAPCHAAIVDEWRASGHAMAWTDPIFQGEYGIEPDKSCRDCHAPQSPGGEPRGVAARDGVGCASCHVRDGHVLGTTGRGAGAHPVAVTPALATAEGCRACHQFPFPPAQPGANFAYAPGAWLQDTHREWSKSQVGTGGIDCQACHMPRVRVPETGETRRSHAFPGMRDPGLLARAVKVTVAARRRGGVVDVDVRLEPGAIGHAFPTGDMFRQAVLRVRTVEADADADERVLKRWFGPLRGSASAARRSTTSSRTRACRRRAPVPRRSTT